MTAPATRPPLRPGAAVSPSLMLEDVLRGPRRVTRFRARRPREVGATFRCRLLAIDRRAGLAYLRVEGWRQRVVVPLEHVANRMTGWDVA